MNKQTKRKDKKTMQRTKKKQISILDLIKT
jgi:hypothetical protein